jgi:hypothetical protein
MRSATFAWAMAITAAFALAGCERDAESTPSLTMESSDLGGFNAIDFRGVARINISVGVPSSVSIEGGSRAVKGLEVAVRDNTLHVNADKSHWNWFSSPQKLVLNIGTPELVAMESNGAGSVHITGFSGGVHAMRVAGAFSVHGQGEVDTLNIKLDGAAHIDYGQVVAQEATVTVNGAGNVEVQAVRLLDATVNGLGAIQYLNEPLKVESSIQGLGAIERKKD